jgi:LmbE family N-acetylglucosaminyl deacetylase
MTVPYTVVSFHAHPDDEALLTAGTLARAAAEGHRVVLVTATDGAAGLTATATHATATHATPAAATDAHATATDAGTTTPTAEPIDRDLGRRRLAELRQAGAAIGCTDVRHLGYDDSGLDGRSGRPGHAFAPGDIEEAAARLAAILTELKADVLTIYDPAGGYGHPDHIQVHRVGTRAGQLAGTPVVLEATVDRKPLVRVLTVLHRLGILRSLGVDRTEWDPRRFASAYAEPDRITHRIDVRPQSGAKRRAMAAHGTQSTADAGTRTLAVFLRLPPFVFKRVFGHEWFVEQGRTPASRRLDDIFASLRADHHR